MSNLSQFLTSWLWVDLYCHLFNIPKTGSEDNKIFISCVNVYLWALAGTKTKKEKD